jgi:hypothetical protein
MGVSFDKIDGVIWYDGGVKLGKLSPLPRPALRGERVG